MLYKSSFITLQRTVSLGWYAQAKGSAARPHTPSQRSVSDVCISGQSTAAFCLLKAMTGFQLPWLDTFCCAPHALSAILATPLNKSAVMQTLAAVSDAASVHAIIATQTLTQVQVSSFQDPDYQATVCSLPACLCTAVLLCNVVHRNTRVHVSIHIASLYYTGVVCCSLSATWKAT